MNLVENLLKSVNFHFWSECNFNCKYCFARFENLYSDSDLSKKDCLEIIKLLKKYGAEKINLAGGEPTLSLFLGSLIKLSKKLGLLQALLQMELVSINNSSEIIEII